MQQHGLRRPARLLIEEIDRFPKPMFGRRVIAALKQRLTEFHQCSCNSLIAGSVCSPQMQRFLKMVFRLIVLADDAQDQGKMVRKVRSVQRLVPAASAGQGLTKPWYDRCKVTAILQNAAETLDDIVCLTFSLLCPSTRGDRFVSQPDCLCASLVTRDPKRRLFPFGGFSPRAGRLGILPVNKRADQSRNK